MKRLALLIAVGALASCGGPSASNPTQLWLAPQGDGNELHVQLTPREPPPF